MAPFTRELGTACWLWTGADQPTGYGKFLIEKGYSESVHRVAWMLTNGIIPDGEWVLHKCDVRFCVNLEHLFLGTPTDNNRDTVRKGHRNDARGSTHSTSKLTESQVLAIRGDTRAETKIAIDYGVSRSLIADIKHRRSWAWAMIPKREAELKAAFSAELKTRLPGAVTVMHSSAGAPDRAVSVGGCTTYLEFKHGTPGFDSPGLQELVCMRLEAAGECRYVVWQENANGTGQRTLIVKPRAIHWRKGWDLDAEENFRWFQPRERSRMAQEEASCLILIASGISTRSSACLCLMASPERSARGCATFACASSWKSFRSLLMGTGST